MNSFDPLQQDCVVKLILTPSLQHAHVGQE